jgi:molecular chaperone DnaK
VLTEITELYFRRRNDCAYDIREAADPGKQASFDKIVADESSYLSSQSYYAIKAKIDELNNLIWEIRRHRPETWISAFYYYANIATHSYTDPQEADRFKEAGEKALEQKNYEALKVTVNQLYNLMPDTGKTGDPLKGTGIG